MANIDVKSIKELSDYNFFIPAYQRDYKWTTQVVEKLLTDISEFKLKEIGNNEKTWYCLQALVLKKLSKQAIKKHNLKGNTLEVIDGQQRLTAIFLIEHYINEMFREKGKNKELIICYETQKIRSKFLIDLQIEKKDNSIEIDNIHYFCHISLAYCTIHSWFQNNKNINQEYFITKFLNYTKVIWFEIEKADSIEIFTKINIGKID